MRYIVASTAQNTPGKVIVATSSGARPALATATPTNKYLLRKPVMSASSPIATVPSNQKPGIQIVNVMSAPSATVVNGSQVRLMPNQQKPVTVHTPGGVPQLMPKVVSVQSGQSPAIQIQSRQVAQVQALPTRINGQIVQVKTLNPSAGMVSASIQVAAPSAPTAAQSIQVQKVQTGAGTTYQPLESLKEVNRQATRSSVSPVSALSAFASSDSSVDAEMGRKVVTVNERFRYIAPTSQPLANTTRPQAGGSPTSTQPSVQLAPTVPAVNQASHLHSNASALPQVVQVRWQALRQHTYIKYHPSFESFHRTENLGV